MSRLTPDGNTKVHIVDTIASLAAITTAELAAGTEITPFITPTGIDTPSEPAQADASDLSSRRDKTVPSTVGGELTFEAYRDDGTGSTTDDAWDAVPEELLTHLVIARFGGTGTANAIVATDVVEVYPVQVAGRSNNRITRAEALRFTSTLALRGDMVESTVT